MDKKGKIELENHPCATPCNSHQWTETLDRRMGSITMEGPSVTTWTNVSILRSEKIRHCVSLMVGHNTKHIAPPMKYFWETSEPEENQACRHLSFTGKRGIEKQVKQHDKEANGQTQERKHFKEWTPFLQHITCRK